ncbi:DNA-directed RNA polymerase III subunit RPC3 [Kwoniella mangroviensis CBS 10435]|uniref:DNA-directed RNA polymerase III subunit RPC3 n=1 Tax=Kwoniella mangroviensis CBS 10435 TaxID=1331196 RepID=A0A1B9IPG3_9TREE|nr:DNA-directed RNA polymerase III subunit RPC3 [Kwoniella mangroviensis CBS 10435]
MKDNGKESVRLCEHIVRQAFGDVISRVASTLLNRGRLPLSTISRLSALPKPTTSAALIILIQHDLVQTNGASYKDTGEEEQYEFDTLACLLRLRWGRILAITHQSHDEVALEVVRTLMIYGKLKVPDIINTCGGSNDAMRADIVNNTIIALVRAQFIRPTSPELHILESDQVLRRYRRHREEMKQNKGTAMLSANDLDHCEKNAQYEIIQERESLQDIRRVLIERPKIDKDKSKKRGKNKAAFGGGGLDEFDYSLQQDVHLRINHDRYGILIRNELIVKAAEERWNKSFGIILKATLDAALNESSRLNEERTNDSIGINEIVSLIPTEDYKYLTAGLLISSKSTIPDIVRNYLNILSGDDGYSISGNNGNFLRRDNGTNPGYIVEFELICRRLKQNLLYQLVREKLGDKAARVLAVVNKSSKAFETTVRDCAMIPLKDARAHLADLQRLSLVETQEVPKTAAKSRMGLPTSAEYHLWAMDEARVYGVLLTNVYKTLGNILQRKSEEIENKKIVLARESRVENLEGGRGLLQLKDQENLLELDDYLKKLTLAEGRSEINVFILRDLPGSPGQK